MNEPVNIHNKKMSPIGDIFLYSYLLKYEFE